MKIEQRKIKDNIVQITTTDERWYQIGDKFVPSVTWITGFYPKGIQFFKWLANHGWDEAESIKQSAGDKGSKVHKAIEDLLQGKEVGIDSKYPNNTTGQDEELTVEEYECLLSFANWFEATKPKVISCELTTYNEQHGYAGTVDFICEINGEPYIIDFKTSQNIWPEHELQLSAYKHALLERKTITDSNVKLAILQLGYRRNKQIYKFTPIEDKFNLFLAAKAIWKNEASNQQPAQKDYPIKIILNFK